MSITSLDQVEMRQVRLTCPVGAGQLESLRLGDLVYLDGVLFTGREGLYHRLIDEGQELPVPLREISNVNFHCSRSRAGGPAAPALRRSDGGRALRVR